MSRRARLEEEKLKALNDDVEKEENRIKAQIERTYAPIIWKRLSSGIRIQDLQPSYYDEVLSIIQECYFQEDVLCRNSNIIDDPESVKSFQQQIMFYLKDRTSIIAVNEINKEEESQKGEEVENKKGDKVENEKGDKVENEKSEEVVGFLILKAVHEKDFGNVFGRVVLPAEGEAFKKCATFLNYLGRKADVYGTFDCNVFLKYHLICVRQKYRHRGLGFQIMSSGLDVARSLNIPVIMGLFSCNTLQKFAKKLGMKVIYEMNYVQWCDRHNELIFPDPGVGNYSCAVMAGAVPPPPVYTPPITATANEKPIKLTRDEKREAKAKAAAKKK